MKSGFPPTSTYKVMVQCCTYNHSLYIEESLKGFAMQQTNFKFVCCVFDDSSTDGEQDTLKRWIENHCNSFEVNIYDHPLALILMAPDKDNPNCIYAIHLQKVNTFGRPEKFEMIAHWEKQCKYEALCEGDDYWIDPSKLQKQVDFLESNIEYSMCFHNAKVHNETNIEFSYPILEGRSYNTSEVFENWIVPTASILFRKEVLNHIVNNTCIINGDINLILACAHCGKIFGMHDYMSIYRVHNNGITLKRVKENNIELQYRYLLHYKCLYNNYKQVTYKLYSRKITDVYLILCQSFYKQSQYIYSLRYFILAIFHNPIQTFRRILLKLKNYE